MKNQHHKQKKAARLWANYANIDEAIFWENYEALLEGNEELINAKLYATSTAMTALFRPPLYAYMSRIIVSIIGIAIFISAIINAVMPTPEYETLPESAQIPLWAQIAFLVLTFALTVLTPLSFLVRLTALEMTEKTMDFTRFFFFKTRIKLDEVEQIQVNETYNNGFRWSHDLVIYTPDHVYTFDYFLDKKQHWSFLEYWKKEGVPGHYKGSHYYGWGSKYAKYWMKYNKEYAAAYEAYYGGGETRQNM